MVDILLQSIGKVANSYLHGDEKDSIHHEEDQGECNVTDNIVIDVEEIVGSCGGFFNVYALTHGHSPPLQIKWMSPYQSKSIQESVEVLVLESKIHGEEGDVEKLEEDDGIVSFIELIVSNVNDCDHQNHDAVGNSIE